MANSEFFSHFPLTNYWYSDKVPSLIRHVLPRTKIVSLVPNASGNYEGYHINDTDSIESVAYHYYGDSRWYWVIAIYNNIDGPDKWPMKEDTLLLYIAKHYPNKALSDVRHYEDELGNEIQYKYRDTSVGAIPVTPITIYDYETRLNDAKRFIKLPLAKFLPQFEMMLNDSMVDA